MDEALFQALTDSMKEMDAMLRPIPENAMRVAPGTDAVVWRINPDHSGEL